MVEPYLAYILRELAPLSRSIPQFEWEHVLVCFAPHQVERLKQAGLMKLVYAMKDAGKVSTDQLAEHPGRFLMSTRSGFGLTKVFDKVGAEHVELVWSLWSGYWNRDGCVMREWAEKNAVHVHFIHSGGHAWPEDLARLTETIGARSAPARRRACARLRTRWSAGCGGGSYGALGTLSDIVFGSPTSSLRPAETEAGESVVCTRSPVRLEELP